MTKAPAPPKDRPRKAARGDAQSDSPHLRARSPGSAPGDARAPYDSAPHGSAPYGTEDERPPSPAPEDEKRARIDELRARIQHLTAPGHVARRHLTSDDDARDDDGTRTIVDVDAPRGRTRRGGARRRGDDTSTDVAGSTKPPPDRTSPAALEQAALRYLNRYDASVEQLRRVLFRHAERHAEGAALARARDDVRALLERYQTSRILDDARYAEALGRGLRARGASAALIRQKLRQRGVAAELVEGALERLAAHDAGADPELAAAKNYVRRKRLTKRHDVTTREGRQKALAALARQGFSFGVASAALAAALDDAESPG